MSYQVLARKWRPQTFADVVGQEHVLTALANGLSLGRIHHAYLFSGTRGVGKTSIARLLAKGLNCETGITATPCAWAIGASRATACIKIASRTEGPRLRSARLPHRPGADRACGGRGSSCAGPRRRAASGLA